MIRLFTYVFVMLMLLASHVQADDEIIFFRIVNDNQTLSFTNYSINIVPPMVQDIAMRTMMQRFSPEMIAKDYYQLTINRNIIWQSQNITQYDYNPLSKDRFRHILWLTEDLCCIVKHEIYNHEGELMFMAISMDGQGMKLPENQEVAELKSDRMYYGFANMHTEEGPEGTFKMLFTDGINRFSVFRALIDKKNQDKTEKLIVYGNNIYNTSSENYRYTVVGGIPFERMEDIISILIKEEHKIPTASIKIKNAQGKIR